jgi:hypothetical protein
MHAQLLAIAPKLQAAMLDVARALSPAYAFTGDIEEALVWFKISPVAEFCHLAPMNRVERRKVHAVVD